MKKNRKVYFPLILVVMLSITSCSLVKPLEFSRVNSFKIGEKAGTKGIVVTTNLSLFNPNNFKVKINNADIDVYAEGINIGKLKIPQTIEIDKKEEFSGDFYIEISFTKLLLAGNSVINKIKSGKMDVQLKGTIDIDFLCTQRVLKVDYVEKIGMK